MSAADQIDRITADLRKDNDAADLRVELKAAWDAYVAGFSFPRSEFTDCERISFQYGYIAGKKAEREETA